MENKNSESKKTKDTQEKIEPTEVMLNKEIDIDADGNKTIVERARKGNKNSKSLSSEIDPDNPNVNRGVRTDKEAMKTVENKDLNSDITANRYPNSNPDNHKDRGNMKLNE